MTLCDDKAQFEVDFFSLRLALSWSWSPAAPGAPQWCGCWKNPPRDCQSAGKQSGTVWEEQKQPEAPLAAGNTSLPQVKPADFIQANHILEQEELQLMGGVPSRLQTLALLSCWSLGFSVGCGSSIYPDCRALLQVFMQHVDPGCF